MIQGLTHYERTLEYDVHKDCADAVVKKIQALFPIPEATHE